MSKQNNTTKPKKKNSLSKKKKLTKKQSDAYWNLSIKRIVAHCRNIGYAVYFGDYKDYVEIDDKEIYINRKSTPERKLYAILHELGHVVINENKQSFTANLGYITRNFSTKSLTAKIAEIEEEYDAWKIGYKIGRHKKIKIDRREFEIYKSACIQTYLKWCVERHEKTLNSPSRKNMKKNKGKKHAKKMVDKKAHGPQDKVKTGIVNIKTATNDELYFDYFDNGKTNLAIRNELAVRNQPLVTYILNKYYSGSKLSYDEKQELIQEGYLGLLNAIEGYNPHLGFKFSTYSSWWVRQAINNYLINVNPIIRVPNHIKSAQIKLMKKLKIENKSYVDMGDLDPEKYDISHKMLNSINSAFKTKMVDSLSSPAYHGGLNTGDERVTLEERISSEDFLESNGSCGTETSMDVEILVEAFKEALKIMPEKRRMILLLRFDVLNESNILNACVKEKKQR